MDLNEISTSTKENPMFKKIATVAVLIALASGVAKFATRVLHRTVEA